MSVFLLHQAQLLLFPYFSYSHVLRLKIFLIYESTQGTFEQHTGVTGHLVSEEMELSGCLVLPGDEDAEQ